MVTGEDSAIDESVAFVAKPGKHLDLSRQWSQPQLIKLAAAVLGQASSSQIYSWNGQAQDPPPLMSVGVSNWLSPGLTGLMRRFRQS